jgi:hypothetical protein
MRRVAMSLAIASSVTATGCSYDDSAGNAAAADCNQQVRLAGVTYTSTGYTERAATKHLPADEAECHDIGETPAGSVFPESPEQVTTWTFDGYPPEKVLGVHFKDDSFAVFVADFVGQRARNRISRALRDPARTPPAGVNTDDACRFKSDCGA